MAAFRIEITFSGDAPDSELDRAMILAGSDVRDAIQELSRALMAHKFEHEVEAKSVRVTPRRSPSARAAANRAAAE